jgi:hypothetical protein
MDIKVNKSQQIKELLVKAGANIRNLVVLGSWVHIDSYAKYESMLMFTMESAGFQCVKVSNGIHMDGTKGFRIVFKVR